MAFSSYRASDEESAMSDINITPLVDVVLVLLIIFMITVPMMKTGAELRLPEGKNAAPMDEKRFVISLTKKQEVYVDGEPVHKAVLKDKLRDMASQKRAVYLEADKGLAYGTVMTFMDNLKSAGIETVALVMNPKSPKAKSSDKKQGKKKHRKSRRRK